MLSSEEACGGPVRMVLDGPSNGKELFGFCTELLACCLIRMFGDERGQVCIPRLSSAELERVTGAIRRTGILVAVSGAVPEPDTVDIMDAGDATPLDRIRLRVPVSADKAMFVGFSFDRTHALT
jgi:hypothetical protein